MQEAEENVGTNGDHAVRAEDVSSVQPCSLAAVTRKSFCSQALVNSNEAASLYDVGKAKQGRQLRGHG